MCNISMNLRHMLVQAALLHKFLRTHAADMRLVSSMVLLVIVHRVLPICHKGAGVKGAHELVGIITDVYN